MRGVVALACALACALAGGAGALGVGGAPPLARGMGDPGRGTRGGGSTLAFQAPGVPLGLRGRAGFARASPASRLVGQRLAPRRRAVAPLMVQRPPERAEAAISMGDVRAAIEEGQIQDVETLAGILPKVPLPKHPRAKFGKLRNGLQYCILPNAAPPGRFECHLEVCAGSADELVSQQGMAHMCEHVSYMGSKKRERLFGTSSQTNAQTDFHHTVYWASSPKAHPSTGKPMLPLALDALCDVMEAKFESSRVEKERSAILSEAAMVNTIDYRVEVQLLSALHAENRLKKRFPIGLVDQIQKWSKEEVMAFHRAHYRPNNAFLYVIGDVDVLEAEVLIEGILGHLEPRDDPDYPESEEMEVPNLKSLNRFLPPVNHEWLGTKHHGAADEPRVHIFQHELMQSFSTHIFAKLPVEPIRSLSDFRAAIIKRIVVVALQIRLNVHARGKPISMVEFSYLDSPREGCVVCALDLVVDSDDWQRGLAITVREFKRMGEHGVSQIELQRCLAALLSDSEQLAAQGDRMTNQDQLQYLMENVACGHTFMDAAQTHEATQIVASSLSVDEVNAAARDICSHIAYFGVDGEPMPSSIVACAPMDVPVSREAVLEAIREAAAQDVESASEVPVPRALLSKDRVQELLAERKPAFVPVDESGADVVRDESGVVLRKLANGVKVNYRTCDAESQRAHLRVTVPCGRSSEDEFAQGAMAVGARTMQEGGAMLGFSREQVELFCVDHLVVAEIACNEEFLFLEFVFPTNKVTDDDEEDVSGFEGVLQIVHALLHGFVWEEDALARAKQAFFQTHEQVSKSLEAAAAEHLLDKMCNSDPRYLSIPPEKVAALTLDDVQRAISAQLTTDNVEVSISGDFNPDEAEEMLLKYIGTVPPSKRATLAQPKSIPPPTLGIPRDLHLDVPDSDARAVAYVAGTAPNRWGVMADGRQALPPLKREGGNIFSSLASDVRLLGGDAEALRKHPLFPCVALLLLQEVLNRRLFSTVRERRRLTYDANFHLTSFEIIQGGWYLVTVTAKPELAQAALAACVETLEAARSWDRISRDNLRSAQYELISKHQGAMQTNKHWVDMMSGIQLDEIASKDLSSITDFTRVVQAVQVEDVQRLLECLAIDKGDAWTCVGVSGVDREHAPVGEEGFVAGADVHGHLPPSLPTRR